MRKLIIASMAVVISFSLESFAVSPNDLATRKGEAIFGQAWLKSVRSQLNEHIDSFCVDLLETQLTRLKNQFSFGSMPLTALCLNNREFNAFAALGGIVGVNRGVYIDLTSESEVMAVLAHELAHIEQRHHYRGFKNSQRMSAGTLATIAGVLASIASRNGQLAQSFLLGGQAANAMSALAYSRDYEREADRIGMRALYDSGYPPSAAIDVLLILTEKKSQTTRDLVFLNTHPLGIERLSDLQARLAQISTKKNNTSILSVNDFQMFRCIQIEGYYHYLGAEALESCSTIHKILKMYRDENYHQAIKAFDQLPLESRQTFSGLDLEIALSLRSRQLDRAEEAIETIRLYFPSWLLPIIATVDLRIARNDETFPPGFREQMVERPERIDLWRALARFANAFKRDYLLFEARGWNALLHGQLKIAKSQLNHAKNSWPNNVDQRPLELLDAAINATENL